MLLSFVLFSSFKGLARSYKPWGPSCVGPSCDGVGKMSDPNAASSGGAADGGATVQLADIANLSSEIVVLSPEALAMNAKILELFDMTGHPRRSLENYFKQDPNILVKHMFDQLPAPALQNDPKCPLLHVMMCATMPSMHSIHTHMNTSMSRLRAASPRVRGMKF